MKRCVAAVLCTTLSLVAVQPAAWAQAGAGGTSQSGPAQQRLEAGDDAAKKGDWPKALENYTAANAAQPSARALLGIATAQEKLGNNAKAFEAYDDLLKTYGRDLPGRDRTKAESRLKDLARVTGALSIRVNEDGATVQVDGVSMGKSPVPQLLRVTSGTHQVQVSKDGFTPIAQGVAIPPDGRVVVTIELKAEQQTGKLSVREKNGREIRVLLDGVDVGAAPYQADLAPKTYEVSGRGSGLSAANKIVSVEKGKSLEVELDASVTTARIEVRTNDGQGDIYVDGQLVGKGSFAGEVRPGEHRIRVVREGFAPFEKTVTLELQQVVAETVTLTQRADAAESTSGERGTRIRDGLYVGAQAGLAFMPWGADTSMDLSCDSLGATSCTPAKPWGALMAAYLGYSLDPIGFELLAGALADLAKPSTHFDGVHGSAINPLVAQPARDEEFTIFRAGGIGAARVRGTLELSPTFQASAALGVGFSWRKLWMRRTVTATDGSGATNDFIPEPVSYWSPGVSADVSVRMLVSSTTMFSAGLWMWGETAKEKARTASEPSRVLVISDSVPPRPLATPAYDLANGPQLYLGPYVGMQFGP